MRISSTVLPLCPFFCLQCSCVPPFVAQPPPFAQPPLLPTLPLPPLPWPLLLACAATHRAFFCCCCRIQRHFCRSGANERNAYGISECLQWSHSLKSEAPISMNVSPLSGQSNLGTPLAPPLQAASSFRQVKHEVIFCANLVATFS